MNKSYFYILAIIAVIFSACSKREDIKPSETLEKITSVMSDDQSLAVELLSDQKLSVGYNALYIRLIDQKTKRK